MIFKMGVLASFAAGMRLRRNIPIKAANSHAATSIIVKLVTTG